jgi:hypothetical protein
MRRPTRLTNAFSKKLSHLKAAVALHFAHYNPCRKEGIGYPAFRGDPQAIIK